MIMKVYHTYESSKGFDLNKQDFERGIFALKPWWVGKKGYEKYSAFHPNEFGNKVVELEIDTNVKTYKDGEQIDVLERFFLKNPKAQKIIQSYEMGQFGINRDDWHKLDTFIGKFLKNKGYKLIHYTDDPMYGDVWGILDKSVIKNVRFG